MSECRCMTPPFTFLITTLSHSESMKRMGGSARWLLRRVKYGKEVPSLLCRVPVLLRIRAVVSWIGHAGDSQINNARAGT